MEDAQRILLEALELAGIVMPRGVASVHDIGPAALISMCSQALRIIGGDGYREEVYMPGSVPQSVSVRFRVCMQLAEGVTQLGYRENLNFHQFLYPNETDVHRLLRFLLEKISKTTPSSSHGRTNRRRKSMTSRKETGTSNIDAVVRQALLGWSDTEEKVLPYRTLDSGSDDDAENVSSTFSSEDPGGDGRTGKEYGGQPRIIAGGKFLDITPDKEKLYIELLSELKETQAKIAKYEKDNSEDYVSVTEEEKKARLAEDDLLVLQQAVKLIKNCSSPHSALEKLESDIETSQKSFDLAQKDWETAKEHYEKEISDSQRSLEILSNQSTTILEEKMLKEIEDISLKVAARKEEQASLTTRLANCPKQAPKGSYVRRITELVKNSKKQETDVTKIIHETRILQRDYNATQERLGRIHLLVDELIFRDAKIEPQCRLAYRILTGMHESFGGLVEKVLEMDKLDREIADLEAKLEGCEQEIADIDKVKDDLNAIVSENNLLETKRRGQ
ncbi:coiled-coil domain-containing protein 22 homolog [Selaginella moellendorffii]|uniref:coiled-coil domain-containing protein 22 homolog n=1 Tax=Selaginella moellendorffii TaxID=88036 RepID=UPI000D1CE3DA|nr:coiled-coil domain-containing protein 22 homolog [Selaginella moellendorffii]|eukprot:XP_024527054.1 coiled-coil domain-containing protein 22 homolog [Selaginella moellendorffii]